MYCQQMQGTDWINEIQGIVNQTVASAQNGSELSDNFNSITYGLTDVQILALPQFSTWTEAILTDVKYALSSLKDLYNCLNNGVVPQANRFAYLEKFLV